MLRKDRARAVPAASCKLADKAGCSLVRDGWAPPTAHRSPLGCTGFARGHQRSVPWPLRCRGFARARNVSARTPEYLRTDPRAFCTALVHERIPSCNCCDRAENLPGWWAEPTLPGCPIRWQSAFGKGSKGELPHFGVPSSVPDPVGFLDQNPTPGPADLLVHRIRRQVCPVGPGHCPQVQVGRTKNRFLSQCLEDRSCHPGGP